MLEQIDTFILSLHQKLVDFTQIEPSKLSKWFMHATLMFYGVHLGLLFSNGVHGWDWVIIGLSPLVAGIVIVTRLLALGAAKTEMGFYRLFLVLAAVIPFSLTSIGVSVQLKVMAEMMMIYIASCHKPKPPKRKNHVSRVLHHST